MIAVHLYGKLRQFSENQNATSASVVSVEWQDGDTIGQVVDRLGIPIEQLGSNVFLNGRYANLESLIHDGNRLGLFPDDMQLLYKWYFAPSQDSGAPQNTAGASNEVKK